MKQIIIIPFTVLFTTSAFAVGDFSGHWTTNTGKIESTVGVNTDCTGIDVTVTQTADKIVIENYKSNCGAYGSEWGPSRMTIKDGKVYLKGEDGEDDDIGTTIVASSESCASLSWRKKFKIK